MKVFSSKEGLEMCETTREGLPEDPEEKNQEKTNPACIVVQGFQNPIVDQREMAASFLLGFWIKYKIVVVCHFIPFLFYNFYSRTM